MRIALASPYDYAMHGGVNQHIKHLKDEFERLGHRVVTIAPLSETTLDIDTPDFHGFGGIVPVHTNGSVARISFSFNLRSRIKELMEAEQFDIVHCHEPLMPALPLAVLAYSRTVNIGTFHAYSDTGLGYFYWRSVLRRFHSRLDGLIAVSEPAADYAQSFFGGEYTVIPNGVDTAAFQRPVDPIRWLMDGRPNLLFLGRFEEERKGFKYAIKAMPWIREIYPDVRLVVVGAGDPSRYASRITRYGIRDNVVFVGSVSNEDRVRYMAGSDLFLAPNTGNESQGIVLLEAMSAGLPVIAGDIPGYRAVVTHGREGLLVQPESEHSLALAAVRLLADRETRAHMSIAARSKGAEYSWPKVASQVLDFYEEVYERKNWQIRREERRKHLQDVFKKARRA